MSPRLSRQTGATCQVVAIGQSGGAGRLDRTAALYRKVLQKSPGNTDALHLPGLTALASGNVSEAIRLIEKALAAAPNFADAIPISVTP